MRILLQSQFYPPIIGGEEHHVRNLGAALAQRGHDVAVATLRYPDACENELDGAVRVYRLKGTMQRTSALFSDPQRRHAPPFPDPELTISLSRLLVLERPDIVHAHNWIVHAYLPLKPLHRVPLVVTLHDYSLVCAKKNLMHAGQPCVGRAAGKCLRCAGGHYGTLKGAVTTTALWTSSLLLRGAADRFLAVSHAVAELNGLPNGRVPYDVIPNFIPDAFGAVAHDPLADQLPHEPYLLFVGDLNTQKGVPVLLDAYARLHQAPPLVLIGRACPDTPRALPPNVKRFTSWPHAAVLQAWQRCLFGIVPSVWPEPCATVVMEGMAAGKPMIVTDIGGMRDLVEPDVNGLRVAPDDAEALAAAMRRLIDATGLRQRLVEGSLRRIDTLRASAVVPRIEGAYQSVLGSRLMAEVRA